MWASLCAVWGARGVFSFGLLREFTEGIRKVPHVEMCHHCPVITLAHFIKPSIKVLKMALCPDVILGTYRFQGSRGRAEMYTRQSDVTAYVLFSLCL